MNTNNRNIANFLTDRTRAFEDVLRAVDKHVRALGEPAVSVVTAFTTDSAYTGNEAERTVWMLFKAGISHLQDGGIERDGKKMPGEFSVAVGKTSIRQTEAAHALGLKLPSYGRVNCYDIATDDGRIFALRETQALIGAAKADFVKSREIFKKALAAIAVKRLEVETDLNPMQMSLLHSFNVKVPKPGIDPFARILKLETTAAATGIIDAFEKVADALDEEVHTMILHSPPRPVFPGRPR